MKVLISSFLLPFSAFATLDDMLELFDKEVALVKSQENQEDSGLAKLLKPGLRDLSIDGINNGDHPMQADTAMYYIRNYGCWCYFEDADNDGRLDVPKGPPRDYLDEMCKMLHQGYECAQMELGESCLPWNQTYNPYPHPPNPNIAYRIV